MIGFGVKWLRVKQLIVQSSGLETRGLIPELQKAVRETPDRDDSSEGYGTMTQTGPDNMSEVIF